MSGAAAPAAVTDKAPVAPPASGDVPQATAPATAAPAADKPVVPAPASEPAPAGVKGGKAQAQGDQKASEKNK